jgi:3-methyladenine DNA glycosylase/8-oxoguanine DNA glycosylase
VGSLNAPKGFLAMHLRAVNHLRSRDPRLAEWIDRIGVIKMPARRSPDPYLALLETIAYQQLAGSAAKKIWGRVVGLFDEEGPRPEKLIELSEEQLRAAGLSRSKAVSMRAIATHTLSGQIPDAADMKRMRDEDIFANLTKVRGVGPWTVEMLLMFTLRRPDIMPATDYGIRKGFQMLYRKRKLPTPKQLLQKADLWRPYRTAAALYLWHIADTARERKKAIS